MSIKRRSFLKHLAAVPFIPLLQRTERTPSEKIEKKQTPESTRYLCNVFSVAGFQYYEGESVLHSLYVGQELELRAEPTNKYDEFAVEILCGKSKLGYVPRSDNKHISRLLQQGVRLEARVEDVDRYGVSWQCVRVEVSLVG